MTTTSIMPEGRQRYYNNDGSLASGCYLYTYAAGTTTPKDTYTNSAGTIPNDNPIKLDSKGEALIYWNGSYKVDLKTAAGVQITGYPVDNYVSSNYYTDTAIATLSAALAASGGAALVGSIQSGTGATARTVQNKLRETISVKDFGAVGDFNHTTGAGTDDRVAIQAALTYAASIGFCEVVFPAGQYYLGTGYTVSTAGLSAQLIIGSISSANAADTITIQGHGAAIFQGAAGCALAIANATNTSINGLKMVGYAGGALNSSREFDNLIGIFHKSKFTSINECYITNSLGYTIYTVGDPNTSGGGTTGTCLNITVRNSVLKMRYGSGVIPNSGGSRSLWAFAAVDAQNVVIQDNVIYGNLEFEPNNVAGQSSYGIFVEGNQFPAGYVTPILPVGASTYWMDEIVGKSNSGGTAIQGSISITGATGSPLNGTNVVSNNSFDQGTINIGAAVYYQWVINNNFRLGKINVGTTSGGNSNYYYNVSGNTTYAILDATSAFIVLKGSVSQTQFHNNVLTTTDFPVIGWDGVGGADGGQNSYMNNSAFSCITNPVINMPSFVATTSYRNNRAYAAELVTWTPRWTDGTNIATMGGAATGTYFIDGRVLHFNLILNNVTAWNGCGAGTYIKLPVVKRSEGTAVSFAVFYSGITPPANTVNVVARLDNATDNLFLWGTNSTGTFTQLAPTTHIALGGLTEVSGTYFI